MILKKITMLIIISGHVVLTPTVWASAPVDEVTSVPLMRDKAETIASDTNGSDEIRKNVLKPIESEFQYLAEKLDLRYPQQDVIDEQVTIIKRQFLVDKLKRYGYRGVGLLVVAYAAYRTLQLVKIISPGNTENKATNSLDESTKLTGDIQKDLEILNNDNNLFKKALSPTMFSLAWFKNRTSVIADIGTGLIFSQTLNNKLNGLVEPGGLLHRDHGSIRWFVQQTTLLSSIEELKQYIMVLDGQSAEKDQNRAMYEYFIVSATNSVVRNLESIMSFIAYKQSRLKGSSAAEINEIERFLFNTTHDFCSNIENTLADQSIDAYTRKNNMETFINELKGETTRFIMSFARIEVEKGI